MDNRLTSGTLWNQAGLSGLILAAVTIACSLLSGVAGQTGSIFGGGIRFAVWAIKLTTCILLFRFFLIRLKTSRSDASHRTLYGYGLRIAFCSSLLVAAFALASFPLTNQADWMEEVRGAMEQMNLQMDSNTRNAMENIAPRLPAVIFFVTLVYCFLWGSALSALFSKSLAHGDLFAGELPSEKKDTDNIN